jgi:ferritin-like metal-binding protein YciE
MENNLLEQLKAKAGLNEEQALKAVQTIAEFIKGKVPPMMHGMIDNFLTEDESIMDKMKDIAETAKENMEGFAKDAGDKMSEFGTKAQDATKDALDKLKGFMKKD